MAEWSLGRCNFCPCLLPAVSCGAKGAVGWLLLGRGHRTTCLLTGIRSWLSPLCLSGCLAKDPALCQNRTRSALRTGGKPHALGFFLSGGFPHSRQRRCVFSTSLSPTHSLTHPTTKLSEHSSRCGWIGARGRESERLCVVCDWRYTNGFIHHPQNATNNQTNPYYRVLLPGLSGCATRRNETIPAALIVGAF